MKPCISVQHLFFLNNILYKNFHVIRKYFNYLTAMRFYFMVYQYPEKKYFPTIKKPFYTCKDNYFNENLNKFS